MRPGATRSPTVRLCRQRACQWRGRHPFGSAAGRPAASRGRPTTARSETTARAPGGRSAPAAADIAGGPGGGADAARGADAVRAAEAREAALRAARTRRLGERQGRENVDASRRRLDGDDYQRRYKTAARKWVSSMIAVPILLVTSYYLFNRLVLGRAPKPLPRAPPADQEKDGGR